MQSVDLVIADIDWLITVDPGPPRHPRCGDRGRWRQDRRRRQVGRHRAELRRQRKVDGRNTVATPGFVDCHLHSSFQLSRGLADESNAQSFLFDRMYPYEAALEADDVRVSATLAGAELLQARRHLLHRSRQLPSRGLGRRRDGDRHPRDRVALLLRSDEIRARHPARAHDRDHRRWRWSAPRRCWSATPSPAIRGSAPAPRSAASTTPPTN